MKYTRPLSCLLHSTAVKLGPCVKIFSKRLRRFHNRCARSMCRVNLYHIFRHHSTTTSLFRRLNFLGIDCYYHNRIFRSTGHVARMPMSWAGTTAVAGKLDSVTSWIAYSRPVGCPQTTRGRMLENALAGKGLSKKFKAWIAIANDRPNGDSKLTP